MSKRQILSQINSIYDPLGLLSPFTAKAKTLMRKIWATTPKVEWDDPIPVNLQKQWCKISNEICQIKDLSFCRSLTPEMSWGIPSLVIISDASCDAYGAVAYIRWSTKDGYQCRLISAKNRMAPLKIADIVRLELCGTVVSKRLRTYIEKELQMSFSKVIILLIAK